MRKKIAKRIKKKCVAQGAVILEDKPSLSKKEAMENNEPRGWFVKAKFKEMEFWCAGSHPLICYRLLKECIDDYEEIDKVRRGIK